MGRLILIEMVEKSKKPSSLDETDSSLILENTESSIEISSFSKESSSHHEVPRVEEIKSDGLVSRILVEQEEIDETFVDISQLIIDDQGKLIESLEQRVKQLEAAQPIIVQDSSEAQQIQAKAFRQEAQLQSQIANLKNQLM